MPENHLVEKTLARVRTLCLNRPHTLNSLTPELLSDLRVALERANADEEVRCVVLTGAGRAFCSGQAIGLQPEPGTRDILEEHYNPVVRTIVGMDKPVIAAVRGIAAGAGAALTLACDLRVLSDDARLAFLFVRVGLAADSGASYFLPRLVGAGVAAELLMLGRDVHADEARRLGLANRVVPGDDLDAAIQELAALLARGPAAVGIVKRQLRLSGTHSLDEQLATEIVTQVEAADTADYREGKAAFAAKRAPEFTGR